MLGFIVFQCFWAWGLGLIGFRIEGRRIQCVTVSGFSKSGSGKMVLAARQANYVPRGLSMTVTTADIGQRI